MLDTIGSIQDVGDMTELTYTFESVAVEVQGDTNAIGPSLGSQCLLETEKLGRMRNGQLEHMPITNTHENYSVVPWGFPILFM